MTVGYLLWILCYLVGSDEDPADVGGGEDLRVHDLDRLAEAKELSQPLHPC